MRLFTYFISGCIAVFLSLIAVQGVFAYQSSLPNNKFGIHLAQPHDSDIKRAAALVNGSGGDWGYITLVMQENDRDTNKWQGVFDQLRKYHLIPIIRLATQPEGSVWKRPTEDDVDGWVSFLNSLNWVVKDRYIILFNEPNHATEWGGSVNAVQYAHVAEAFAQKLKETNRDYFPMIAGLDASAPQELPSYSDEAQFLQQVVQTIGSEKFNALFDGLSSHSYPNPGFVGSDDGNGRGSIRTYQWEEHILNSWGVKKLPVFITETGWDGVRLSRQQVADDFEHAYLYVWLPDNQVVAVTPFVLNYQGDPFLPFSWVTPGENGVYPQYDRIEELPKEQGKPEIIQNGNFSTDLPAELVEQSHYTFPILVTNTGQGYWNPKQGYSLALKGIDQKQYSFTTLPPMGPNESREITLNISTGAMIGNHDVVIQVLNGTDVVLQSTHWKFSIVPLPSLTLKVNLYPKLSADGTDYGVQIFDEKEHIVFEQNGVVVKNNSAHINGVANIALGRPYRIVVRKVPYLPRQTIILFTQGENKVTMKRMYPLDYTGDGAFTIDDVWAFLRHPRLVSFFFP